MFFKYIKKINIIILVVTIILSALSVPIIAASFMILGSAISSGDPTLFVQATVKSGLLALVGILFSGVQYIQKIYLE